LKSIPFKDHDRHSIHRYLRYLFWLGEYDRAGEFLDSVSAFNPREVEMAVKRLCNLEKDVYLAFVKKGRDVSE